MANVFGVHSVGSSLATYLTNTYPEPLRSDIPCRFTVFSSGELDSLDFEELGTTLSFTLYRITVNEHLRNSTIHRQGGTSLPLSLELHYLMTSWARSALAEQTVLTWAMRELHQQPVLDLSRLSTEAAWATGDVVQIMPEELGIEALTNIWEAITPAFRLSSSYVARVVRIDTDPIEDSRPVVATRFGFSDEVPTA